MVIHNNFQDFVLFLYVHMASADSQLAGLEEEVILGKMKKLFPNEQDLKKKFEHAVAEYRSYNHDQVMDIVRSTFKAHSEIKFAQKYKVYTDMFDIINADGRVEESERAALDALKEIIDINAEAK